MFFIVLAGFLQYYDISLPPFYAQTFSYLANTIFLILIFIWGKSIRQRIIQKGIRRKLVIIAVLLFFWLFIRFIKYNAFQEKIQSPGIYGTCIIFLSVLFLLSLLSP